MLDSMPSYVGEAAAVVAVLHFVYWAALQGPKWTMWVWMIFAVIFMIDWMWGGIVDQGICRNCFGKKEGPSV